MIMRIFLSCLLGVQFGPRGSFILLVTEVLLV